MAACRQEPMNREAGRTVEYQLLKDRHRQERGNWHINLSLRVHRALSWLDRAEQCEDEDGAYIFLWIAFNAAYANHFDHEHHVREDQKTGRFFQKICDLDGKGQLKDLIWREFSGPIRVLLDNQYVFQPFWDFAAGNLPEEEWLEKFEQDKRSANRSLSQNDVAGVLATVFSRLYTLRNQLVHGGATWNGSLDRDQIRGGVRILGKLTPIVISIMMDNPETVWGDPVYPIV